MYCYKCGLQIDEKTPECEHCGAYTAHVMRPKFYKTSIFLGLCPFLLPLLGFAGRIIGQFAPYYYFLLIFSAIGLPLAFISKRKSAVTANIVGIVLWIILMIPANPDVEESRRNFNEDEARAILFPKD